MPSFVEHMFSGSFYLNFVDVMNEHLESAC